jgi:hypothetical protein
LERCQPDLYFGIILGKGRQYADPPHSLRLLRPCRERPRGRRAAEQRDELAPFAAGRGFAGNC